jgi:hypothetical protein
VKDRRNNGIGVEVKIRENRCGGNRVSDIRLTGEALLSFVSRGAKLGGLTDAGNLLGGEVAADRGQQLF